MKTIVTAFIGFYQRFISPYKGFHCAHHVLHRGDTCSNAIKYLVLEHGLFKSRPYIKNRFHECRVAYNHLQASSQPSHSADISCDLPCDIGFGDCGGSSSGGGAFDCLGCDWPFGRDRLSRRTKRFIDIGLVLTVLVLAYVFYGRQIGSVYVTDLGVQQQGLIKRLVQREHPQVRVVLLIDGEKHYSDIVQLDQLGVEHEFELESSIAGFEIDAIQILDARLNIANKLVVVGQVLEEFEAPKKQDVGQRFRYRLKRRWHFY